MNLLALVDTVGISCRNEDCGVFIGISGLSKEHDVLFINHDIIEFLGSCMICDSKEGFEKVSHIKYHAQYLEEEEFCKYC